MKFLILLMVMSCATKVEDNSLGRPVINPVSVKDFSVKSTIGWISETASIAECVIKRTDFIAEVAKTKSFDFSKDTGVDVARKMSLPNPVILSSYCKKPSFGRQTNAYRNVGSNIVYMNTCVKLNRIEKRVNTLVHERLHVVGYGHGNNNYKGKENSVPYAVGAIAEKYVKGCL